MRSKYAARRKGRVAGEVGPGYVGTGIIRCGEHLTLHVDLPALLNHDGPGRGKFRPMIQWARNALIENPNGVAEIDTRVVRNLALFTGCKHHELAEYLAQFTPPPGDIDTEENPDKHE